MPVAVRLRGAVAGAAGLLGEQRGEQAALAPRCSRSSARMMGRQRALSNARGEHPYVCARITGTHAPQGRANAASLPGGVGCGSVFALSSLPSTRPGRGAGPPHDQILSTNASPPHPLSFRCREGGSLPSRAQPSRPPAGASIFRLRALARQPNTPAERPRQGPSGEIADMRATTQQRRPACWKVR
jgi:hypothetical protein